MWDGYSIKGRVLRNGLLEYMPTPQEHSHAFSCSKSYKPERTASIVSKCYRMDCFLVQLAGMHPKDWILLSLTKQKIDRSWRYLKDDWTPKEFQMYPSLCGSSNSFLKIVQDMVSWVLENYLMTTAQYFCKCQFSTSRMEIIDNHASKKSLFTYLLNIYETGGAIQLEQSSILTLWRFHPKVTQENCSYKERMLLKSFEFECSLSSSN